jgi:hypothetical protein
LRQKVVLLVESNWFENFIIVLVVIFTLLIFIYFSFDSDASDSSGYVQYVVQVATLIETIILCLFLLEIFLKSYGLGLEVSINSLIFQRYYKDRWQLFDVIVIFLSLILIIIDYTINDSSFKVISKLLRTFFRFLRLFLVFKKVTFQDLPKLDNQH